MYDIFGQKLSLSKEKKSNILVLKLEKCPISLYIALRVKKVNLK